MDGFDNEIERAVTRAGRTALGLNLVAGVLVTITLVALAGPGNEGGASYIGFGEAVGALGAAGVFHGLATLVHLNGMQLMETWRQGRRSER